MPSYDEFRALVTNASAEEKLGVLRQESKRLLNVIHSCSLLIQKMVEERGAPQMPDSFGDWCNKIADSSKELTDLIDALTDWKHRSILQQELANHKREFDEQGWQHEQVGLPELQDFESFTTAILQTAQKLDLPLDQSSAGEIKRSAFFHPGSLVEFFTPERRARVGSQVGKGGRYVGYVVALIWLADERNLDWREHEGLIRSLDEAVTVLHRWLVEKWDLESIRQEYQWMREGIVHRDSL
jgi:hypothetical protein